MSLATEVAIKIECKQRKCYLDRKIKIAIITNCQLYNNYNNDKINSKSRWSFIVEYTRDVSIL